MPFAWLGVGSQIAVSVSIKYLNFFMNSMPRSTLMKNRKLTPAGVDAARRQKRITTAGSGNTYRARSFVAVHNREAVPVGTRVTLERGSNSTRSVTSGLLPTRRVGRQGIIDSNGNLIAWLKNGKLVRVNRSAAKDFRRKLGSSSPDRRIALGLDPRVRARRAKSK